MSKSQDKRVAAQKVGKKAKEKKAPKKEEKDKGITLDVATVESVVWGTIFAGGIKDILCGITIPAMFAPGDIKTEGKVVRDRVVDKAVVKANRAIALLQSGMERSGDITITETTRNYLDMDKLKGALDEILKGY